MELNSRTTKLKFILTMHLPWLIAVGLQSHPILSYLIAWSGSFFIFYLSICSPLSIHNPDLPIRLQVMRPIVLIQLIFAGFMCCSSIFYFSNHLNNLIPKNIILYAVPEEKTFLIAECQRYSLLAHAALVTGITMFIRADHKSTYTIKSKVMLLPKIALLSFSAAILLNDLPGMLQFKYPLHNLSIACGTYMLIKGLINKTRFDLITGTTIFSIQLVNASLSGYKEVIIVQFILLSFLLFHHYPKLVMLLSPFCIIALLYILPTFTSVMRTQSWVLGRPTEEARTHAYQVFFDEQNEDLIFNNSKEFLHNRITEIGMFVQYVSRRNDQQEDIAYQMISQSFLALIPKVIWPSKPSSEKIAMERVYRSGVANRASNVSAKTRPVVDGYLMAGIPGIAIYMFLYGAAAQLLCNLSEHLFGGYQLGCSIVFNSLFQPLWRGNNLEFLLNNICYGLVLLLAIHWLMLKARLISKPQ